MPQMGSKGLSAAVVEALLEAERLLVKLNCMGGTTPGGTFGTNPHFCMDGNDGNAGIVTVVDQYANLALGGFCKVYGFRHLGDAINTSDVGRYKIEYHDEYGDWHDLVTDIHCGQTANFSTYEAFTAPVVADDLRFTCTTYHADSDVVAEVEFRGVKLE